jgi:hypothetical protein
VKRKSGTVKQWKGVKVTAILLYVIEVVGEM